VPWQPGYPGPSFHRDCSSVDTAKPSRLGPAKLTLSRWHLVALISLGSNSLRSNKPRTSSHHRSVSLLATTGRRYIFVLHAPIIAYLQGKSRHAACQTCVTSPRSLCLSFLSWNLGRVTWKSPCVLDVLSGLPASNTASS